MISTGSTSLGARSGDATQVAKEPPATAPDSQPVKPAHLAAVVLRGPGEQGGAGRPPRSTSPAPPLPLPKTDERPRCQHCPCFADERSFMCMDCACEADSERDRMAEALRAIVLAPLHEVDEKWRSWARNGLGEGGD